MPSLRLRHGISKQELSSNGIGRKPPENLPPLLHWASSAEPNADYSIQSTNLSWRQELVRQPVQTLSPLSNALDKDLSCTSYLPNWGESVLSRRQTEPSISYHSRGRHLAPLISE